MKQKQSVEQVLRAISLWRVAIRRLTAIFFALNIVRPDEEIHHLWRAGCWLAAVDGYSTLVCSV
jgi:hypothetical protein